MGQDVTTIEQWRGLAEARHGRGVELFLAGKYEEARAMYAQAISSFNKIPELQRDLIDKHYLALMYYNLGHACMHLQQNGEAQQANDTAMTYLSKPKRTSNDWRELAASYRESGYSASKNKEYSQAQRAYETAIECIHAISDLNKEADDWHVLATCYNKLGITFSVQKQHADAIVMFEKAIGCLQKIPVKQKTSVDETNLAFYYCNLARAQCASKQYDAALAAYIFAMAQDKYVDKEYDRFLDLLERGCQFLKEIFSQQEQYDKADEADNMLKTISAVKVDECLRSSPIVVAATERGLFPAAAGRKRKREEVSSGVGYSSPSQSSQS